MINYIKSWFKREKSDTKTSMLSWGSVMNSSSVENSLHLAAVFQAVEIIAGDIAQMPIHVYKRNEAGRERDLKHIGGRLMSRKPNETMTPFHCKFRLQADALLHGNGYGWIRRNRDKISIIPLNPRSVKILTPSDDVLLYEVTVKNGEKFIVRDSDMLNIRGLGDGIKGRSRIELARDTIGIGLSAESYAWRFFKNYCTPQGILSTKGKKPTPEMINDLRTSWLKMTSGEEGTGVAVVWDGLEYVPIAMNNKDSQYLETRQFNRSEIASWFNLPAHMLNDLSRATFSNIVEQNQQYLQMCLSHWLTAWSEEMNSKLLTEQEKEDDTHFFEFKSESLLKLNLLQRYQAYQIAVGRPWMTPNQIRNIENQNDIEGGDILMVPLNFGNTGGTQPTVNDEPEPVDTSTTQQAAQNAINSLVQTEINRVVKDSETCKNFINMVDSFYLKWSEKIPENIRTEYVTSAKEFWFSIADNSTKTNLTANLKKESDKWKANALALLKV
jgi:HK97 family phage portal protein